MFIGRLPPKLFHELRLVRSLDLSSSNLEIIPDAICRLHQLQFLNLENNKIRKLPKGCGRLLAISDINISRNNLMSLPNIIPGWKQLTNLDVSHNRLVEPFISQNLHSVKCFKFVFSIISVPKGLCLLPSLVKFDVSHNELTEVEAMLFSMKSLKVFNTI